eukprot:scaffold5790_cov101-Isochrysis_galbana.AAC.3
MKTGRSMMKKGSTATAMNTKKAATKKRTETRDVMEDAVRASPRSQYMKPIMSESIVYIAKRTQ